MRIALALILSIAFATASLAGPRHHGDPYWKPCDYGSNANIDGTVAGVLGAYILMFPRSRVNVLLGTQVVAMPALVVLGFRIVLQLVSGAGSIAATDESSGGVAYMAHIGGFASGVAMTYLFRGRSESDTLA